MTTQPASLDILTVPPPTFSVDEVATHILDQFGLAGEFTGLVSERDQNFRLSCDDGRRYVVKITNSGEPEAVTDFQIQALLHMEKYGCAVVVPRIIRTIDGSVSTTLLSQGLAHVVRVATFVPGRPLEVCDNNAELARKLGICLAKTDAALSGFEHPGDSPALIWDMQRACDLRELVKLVPDERMRATVIKCLDDFEHNALSKFAALRSQIIHNDLNPGNVLVTVDEPPSVAGVIDFGDMLRAPLIIDVAIAASYIRSAGEDALELLAPFVAGFNEVTPLDQAEIELLYDLIRTRLVTTIVLMNWRLSTRPASDAYMKKGVLNERSSEGFLIRLNDVTRAQFDKSIASALDNEENHSKTIS